MENWRIRHVGIIVKDIVINKNRIPLILAIPMFLPLIIITIYIIMTIIFVTPHHFFLFIIIF